MSTVLRLCLIASSFRCATRRISAKSALMIRESGSKFSAFFISAMASLLRPISLKCQVLSETLLLCEVEEMSYPEIAGILSIPTGTAMSRLARARKAVRESLVALSVHRHPRKQHKEPGAMREVSIDQDFAAEENKVPCP
jgi:hypothetical protein